MIRQAVGHGQTLGEDAHAIGQIVAIAIGDAHNLAVQRACGEERCFRRCLESGEGQRLDIVGMQHQLHTPAQIIDEVGALDDSGALGAFAQLGRLPADGADRDPHREKGDRAHQ